MAVEVSGTIEIDGVTYLSTEEVARRLSIWRRTVRRAIERGALDAIRIGHDLWVDERSIPRYRPVYGRGHWGPREKAEESPDVP